MLLSPAEMAQLVKHGPWPPTAAPDPSNRVSGQPEAIGLGRALFFDPRLSANGKLACATCHDPAKGWSDGRPRAVGITGVDRNTQSLFDVRLNRWFGWDGAGDSLWAQSLRPVLEPREMGASAAHVARVVAATPDLAARYAAVFGRRADGVAPDDLLVDAAKALAAFQETMVSGRSAFDDFRDALARGDMAAAASYPASAQRGAQLFVGRGKCDVCHVGAALTNGEFHDIGLPFFLGPGKVDPGRHGGIEKLKASPFNLLGRFNDDSARKTAWATRHVAPQHRNFGEFKVPSLRNVALTAPYMHDGSKATLADVVRHYSELDESRLHVHGERVLRRLGLSEQEIGDLVAFLETLTEHRR